MQSKSIKTKHNLPVHIMIIMASGWQISIVGLFPSQITLAALISYIAIICCLRGRRILLPKKSFCYALIHCLLILMVRLTHDDVNGWTTPILWVEIDIAALMIIVYYRCNFRKFIDDFLFVFKWITIISLIGYIFINRLELVHLPQYGVKKLYDLGIVYGKISSNYRNCGLFWEPGIYAEYLAFAILFEVLLYSNIRKSNVLLYLIAIITTESTTGYIMAGMILILRMLHWKSPMLKFITQSIASVFIAVTAIGIDRIVQFLARLMPRVFSKIANETVNYTARVLSPQIMFGIFTKSPLNGFGYQVAITKFNNEASMIRGVDTAVDTITIYLASLGIGGLLPIMYVSHGVFRQNALTFWEKTFLLVIFLVAFYSEPHTSLLFIHIIVLFLAETSIIGKNT